MSTPNYPGTRIVIPIVIDSAFWRELQERIEGDRDVFLEALLRSGLARLDAIKAQGYETRAA